MVTLNHPQPHCPSIAEWANFLEGELCDLAIENCSRHLADCDTCLAMLDRLSNLPDRKRPYVPSPYLEEDSFLRFERQLARFGADQPWSFDVDDLVDTNNRSFEIPAAIGRFEISKLLGAGAFGKVYLAHDPLLEREVAIKVPKEQRFHSEAALSVFLAEARHAAALDHPGIVPIYDLLEGDSGQVLIVMKFVKGQTLSSASRSGGLTLQRSVEIVKQIANAVHFAHERGCVHRDLKPSNILIDDNGNVYITDFGLGMKLSDEIAGSRGRAGTPQYMSPEQVENDVMTIDQRSDVWALGVILVELVHGVRPFPQRDRCELFQSILTQEPAIDSAIGTRSLDEIAKRCLAKSATERFQSANDLAIELEAWLRKTFPFGMRRWLYGRRRLALLAASVVLMLFGWWATIEYSNKENIRLMIERLESAPADQIPVLVEELRAIDCDNHRISEHYTALKRSGKLRITACSVALGNTRPELIGRLVDCLETANPNEIQAIRKVFDNRELPPAFVAEIAGRFRECDQSSRSFLTLAGTLSSLDTQNPSLSDRKNAIANALTRLSSGERLRWFQLFDRVSKTHLAQPIQHLMNSPEATAEVQESAVAFLIRCFSSDIPMLAKLVMEADSVELALIVNAMKPKHPAAVNVLTDFYRQLRSDGKGDEITRVRHLSRLSVALWLLDSHLAIFDAFQHASNPTLQTLAIHGLVDQQVSPAPIWLHLESNKSLTDHKSVAIRFSCLQVLALLPRECFSDENHAELLNEIYHGDGDCGVHSAVRLLARNLNVELVSPNFGINGNWLADRIGNMHQDFAIVMPCSTELGICKGNIAQYGSQPWPKHRRKFTRPFAISTNEVTALQFRSVCEQLYRDDVRLRDASNDAAMMLVTREMAYRFCNVLSAQLGLPKCYQPSVGEDGTTQLIPKQNHVAITGYRLPTDGEWELACRGGTTTSRYFGDVPELVSSYGWVGENLASAAKAKNGVYLSQGTSNFLCNRWGLFDMYGNAKELCDMSCDPIQSAPICREVPGVWSKDVILLRGLGMLNSGEAYAHSHARTNLEIDGSNWTIGFRICRTLTLKNKDYTNDF